MVRANRILVVLGLLCTTVTARPASAGHKEPAKAQLKEQANLSDLLKVIATEYSIAKEQLALAGIVDIEIQELDAIFDSTNTVTVDGNISVWLIKTDVSRATTHENKLTFSFKRPEPQQKLANAPKGELNKPAHPLATAIFNAEKALSDVRKAAGESFPKLTDRSCVLELTYTVEWDGKTEINATVFKLGVGASLEDKKTVTHTIALTFGPAAAPARAAAASVH